MAHQGDYDKALVLSPVDKRDFNRSCATDKVS